MFTHTVTRQVSTSSGGPVGGQFSLSAGAENNIDEAIPGGATNLAVAFAIAIAKLRSICIVSDQDLVIKTNSSTVPANQFELLAGVPLIWTVSDGGSFQDTDSAEVTSITSLFVTNAEDVSATLRILALVDPT